MSPGTLATTRRSSIVQAGSLTDCPGPTNRISTHTFQLSTSFVINLVVTDSAGRIGSHTTSISIATGNPMVTATASPGSPNPGQLVFFNSSATTYYPGTTGISTFAWTFGDGTGSALANPSHSYAAVGAYSVGLAVTDGKGRTGIGGTNVTVVAVTPPTPPTAPTAAFNFSPVSPKAGVTSITFDGTPSTGSNLTYTWNFGDGSFGAGRDRHENLRGRRSLQRDVDSY